MRVREGPSPRPGCRPVAQEQVQRVKTGCLVLSPPFCRGGFCRTIWQGAGLVGPGLGRHAECQPLSFVAVEVQQALESAFFFSSPRR